jgi:PAS domain S-box-containing protein
MKGVREETELGSTATEWQPGAVSLESVLAGIDDHLVCFDHQWRYTYLNDKVAEILGKSKGELLGQCVWDLFPDAVGNQFYREMHDAAAKGYVIRSEYYSDRVQRWFENHIYPTPEGVTVLSLDITLQKKGEESHREHEALLRNVGDHLPGAIYQVMATRNGERRFQYISAGIETLLGIKPAAVLADPMSLYSLIVEEDIPRVLAEEERAYRALAPFDCEFRQRTVSGEVRWMHCRSAPRCARDGTVVWDGVVLDVTNRKRAEQALERYRLLAERTSDIVMFMRIDGQIVEANDAAIAAYGYTREELLACNIAELRAPATRHLLPQQKQDADRHGIRFETVHCRKDGSLFPVEVSSRGTEMDGQRVLLSIIRDITVRREAARSIEFLSEASKVLASSLDYQTTLTAVAQLYVPELADWCAIDVVEPDGSLKRVAVAHTDPAKAPLTQEVHRLMQAEPYANRTQEIMRTGRSEMHSDVDDEQLRLSIANPRLLELLRQLGLRSYIGMPLKVRDRTLGVLTIVASISGRTFGPRDLALAEDLAHRAAMAIENSRLYAEVTATSRRKDEFLATLAHELRNPLAPIRNAAQLFQMVGPLPPELEQARAIVDRQVEQLTRLVDDLLDVSRFVSGKVELRRQRVELAELIVRAIEMSQPLISASRHELLVDQAAEPLWLDADPTRITQVIANLLNNSAKYMEPEGSIWLTTHRERGKAVITVRDTGIGISRDMLGQIFQPFTQVDTSVERRQGGLGIGLTLVQRLVTLHGGTVSAYSAGRGCGSTFEVRLPLLKGTTPRLRENAPTLEAKRHGGRRIIVVDDNHDSADTLAVLLRKLGHQVHTAYNGQRALELAAELRPDLMVVDLGMPGMSGYDVAKRLKSQPASECPVLAAMTGWGQEDDQRRSREAGFDCHLVKPVDLKTLEDLLALVKV